MSLPTAKENINILSLEGGGVKGILQLAVLAKIEAITGKPICKLYDYIAGTSVGSLIAALLTIPKEKDSMEPLFSATETIEIFQNMAQDIFPDYSFRKIWSLNGLLANKYSPEPLKNLLEEYCKDTTLADTIIPIIVPVCNINQLKAPLEVLSTMEARKSADNNYLLKDILQGATAAPSYFPKVPVTNVSNTKSLALIDGGVAKNCPSLPAYILLYKDYNINNMTYMSSEDYIQEGYSSMFWGGGILDILKNNFIEKIFLNTPQQSDEHLIEKILGDNYYKISIPLNSPTNNALDNSSEKNLQELKNVAVDFVKTEGNTWFKGIVDNLIKSYDAKHPDEQITVNLDLYQEYFSDIPPGYTEEFVDCKEENDEGFEDCKDEITNPELPEDRKPDKEISIPLSLELKDDDEGFFKELLGHQNQPDELLLEGVDKVKEEEY